MISVGDQWCKNCLRKLISSLSNFASNNGFLFSKTRGAKLL